MKKRDADERFWEKVEKTDSCWNWVAYKDREGYGRFSVNLKPCYGTGGQGLAHRL